jgi:hypothetical protein
MACFSYDKEGDSLTNFIQRVLGGFGDLDGARNLKGKVKSSFLNFQAEFGKIMLERKMGSVKKYSLFSCANSARGL